GDGELRSVKDYLRRSDVEFRVLTLGSEYDPAEQILDTATGVGAELIVLGTRKRTPVGKFLLGSTIQKVILDATAPVLCVKAAHQAPHGGSPALADSINPSLTVRHCHRSRPMLAVRPWPTAAVRTSPLVAVGARSCARRTPTGPL